MPVIVSADPTTVEEVPEVPELTIEDAEEQLLAAAEPERKSMARKFAAFACTNGFAPMEQMEWRDMLKRVAFLSFDDFKVIQKDAQETKKAERRAARKIQPAESDAEGLTLPDPGNPMAVARALVRQLPSTDGTSHSAWHREAWYTWTGSKWASQEEAAVRQWVYLQTEHATYEVEDAEGELVEKAWRPTVEKVHGVVDAMGVGVLQRHGEPSKDIAWTNGVLELDSRALLPHTPQRFNLHSLPFGYDATAVSPEWMKFLGQVLPGDQESVEFLQEWFGYVISGRTDLQKMASIIGPPRSGKGTIARVLEALLGPESVASPSMDKLGGQFGEQNLIGKRLATLSDVRWNSRSVNDAVPVLLAIIGEDSRDIPRKNREDWHGKIDARFMMMSNDTPSFTDASGALATRMIHIRMFESFVGKEDHGLTARLLAELPGILNWALEGLDRLTARGRFIVPQASQDVDRDVREIAQPVVAFVEEMCTLETGAEILLDDLYAAWRVWNLGRGLGEQYIGQKSTFAQKMTSAFGGKVRSSRKMVDGKKVGIYTGIRTTNPFTAPPQQQWIVGNR
jgi:putative DNA primase/helicase